MTSSPSGNPFDSVQEMMRSMVSAQERSFSLAQGWTQSVADALNAQAEAYTAMMRATESSFATVERFLASQEESNRALKESLESVRGMLTAASASQERTTQLAQNLVTQLIDLLKAQVESGQRLLAPAALQGESFQRLAKDWTDAYAKMLEAPLAFFGAEGAKGPSKT